MGRSHLTVMQKIKKTLFVGTLLIAGLLTTTHFIYVASGSNQWELVGEKKGVKLYSLKSPGSALKKFKAVKQFESKISPLVKMMSDGPDISDETGFYDSRDIEKVDNRFFYSTFKTDLGIPFFKPREFLIRNHVYQNPRNKVVYYEVKAVPGKIPVDDCCFRVAEMHNSWTITPLQDGMVELAWEIDMSIGMPYFLVNEIHPTYMYYDLNNLVKISARDVYQAAEYDWIEEVAVD